VYVYDPTQDNWTEEIPLPQQRANAGVAEISGKIVIIGGISQAGKLDEVIYLIPYQTRGSDGSWSTETIFPSKCQRVTVSSIVNTIYSIADDCLDETLQSKLIVFNQAGMWELIESPVQIDRTNSRLVNLDSYIYLLGGVINNEPIGNVIRYKAFYTVVVPIVR
jgi:hypothetical protein